MKAIRTCEGLRTLDAADVPSPVDREAGVIRGVKILGLQSGSPAYVIGVKSDQPYTYSFEALKAAVPLYEGVAVNLDHPEFRYKSDGSRDAVEGNRKAADRFGRLINVRAVDGKGLYGDLEYLKSHPMAERVCEAAERMPEIFALSHHAFTQPKLHPDGRVTIERIAEVVSVDLIGEKPGTTRSLFESLGDTMQDEETQVTEQETGLEEEEQVVTTEEEEAAPASDPAEQVKMSFVDAALAVLTDDGLSEQDKISKITDLINAQKAAVDTISGGETGGETGGGEATESRKPAKPQSGAHRELTVNERMARLEARALLAESGVKATDVQIKAVAALESEADRQALVATFAKQPRTQQQATSKPRSAAPSTASGVPTVESRVTQQKQGKEDFGALANKLRGR